MSVEKQFLDQIDLKNYGDNLILRSNEGKIKNSVRTQQKNKYFAE